MSILGITRLGDKTKQVGSHMPAASIEASDFVTIDGIGICFIGNLYATHSDGDNTHIGKKLVTGSSFVAINSVGIGRKTDILNCGAIVDECSDFVTIEE